MVVPKRYSPLCQALALSRENDITKVTEWELPLIRPQELHGIIICLSLPPDNRTRCPGNPSGAYQGAT